MKKYMKSIIYLFIFSVVILTSIKVTTVLNNRYKDIKEKNDRARIEGVISFTSNRVDKKKELDKLISDFEELYPNIRVNMELLGDAEAVLQRKASVGELSDITMVPGSISNTSELDKYFLSIDDLGLNKGNIYNYMGGTGMNGDLYNITSSITWIGVVYNKKIFEQIGVNTTPKTIDEFMEICNRIKSIGKIPVTMNYMQPWTMSSWIDVIPYLYDMSLEEDIVKGKKDIMSEESGIYKSLELARSIVDNKYCENNLLNYSWESFKQDMSTGKVAMTIWNSQLIYQLEDLGANYDEFGIFPLPESKRIIINGDYKYAISKYTKYPEAAKEFFKYLFLEGNYYKAVNVESPLILDDKKGDLLEYTNQYGIPVVFESELSSDNFVQGINYHAQYSNIKKNTGLNSIEVQEYLISSDKKKLREEINEKWKKELNKLK